MDGTTVPNREEGEEETFDRQGNRIAALLIFLRGRYSSLPLEEALKRVESLRPSFSVVSVEGLFPWRDRERARNEGARHAIKGQLETRERFPGKQPCCVPPSPHRSEIRGTIDSRNRGEQALQGLRDFLVTCAR